MPGSVYLTTLLCILLGGCASVAPRAGDSLQPFSSERPLEEFVRKSGIWYEETSRISKRKDPCVYEIGGCDLSEWFAANGLRRDGPFTTNLEGGAERGDIVRRAGDYIVLLRRGRLFTFVLQTDRHPLAAIDYIDVAAPEEDIDASYDEILSYEDTIIVLGYSHDFEASLIRMFEIDGAGRLSAGRSYFFKSSDHFYDENYSARLVGRNLVFYIDRDLPEDWAGMVSGQIVNGEPVNAGGAFTSETIYQPVQQSSYPTLHTIASCPLNAQEFKCVATSIVGPGAELVYIGDDAVYLWLNSSGWAYDYFMMSDGYVRHLAKAWRRNYVENDGLSVIYRVPIEGGIPGAIEVRGWPVDYLSLRETPETLQAFARESKWGRGMRPSVFDIPLSLFGPRTSKLPASRYQYLPPLEGYTSVIRFVGSSLLYDDIVDEGDGDRSSVWVKNLDSQLPPARFPVDHLVERIDAVGDIAIVIGTDERSALGLTSVSTGSNPAIGQTTWLDRAVQADERRQSFGFRPGESLGVIGFPVIYVPEGENYEDFWADDLDDVHMTFLGLRPDLGFQALGEFVGHSTEDDDCAVSCTDFYADSRLFFVDDRIYALLRYELIEGHLSGATLQESARVNGLALLSQQD